MPKKRNKLTDKHTRCRDRLCPFAEDCARYVQRDRADAVTHVTSIYSLWPVDAAHDCPSFIPEKIDG